MLTDNTGAKGRENLNMLNPLLKQTVLHSLPFFSPLNVTGIVNIGYRPTLYGSNEALGEGGHGIVLVVSQQQQQLRRWSRSPSNRSFAGSIPLAPCRGQKKCIYSFNSQNLASLAPDCSQWGCMADIAFCMNERGIGEQLRVVMFSLIKWYVKQTS